MKVRFISAEGREMAVEAQPGKSLMQVAVQANVAGIEAECGGMMTCGTCHVYVRAPFVARLPQATEEERSMLEFAAAPVKPCSRLSCQISLTAELDDLVADIPECQY